MTDQQQREKLKRTLSILARIGYFAQFGTPICGAVGGLLMAFEVDAAPVVFAMGVFLLPFGMALGGWGLESASDHRAARTRGVVGKPIRRSV